MNAFYHSSCSLILPNCCRCIGFCQNHLSPKGQRRKDHLAVLEEAEDAEVVGHGVDSVEVDSVDEVWFC